MPITRVSLWEEPSTGPAGVMTTACYAHENSMHEEVQSTAYDRT